MKEILILLIMMFMADDLKSQDEKNVNDVHGLLVGTQAPMFRAIDDNRNEFSLEDAIVESSVVLIFYRGFWCPYCNKHLSSLQDSLKLIQEKGGKVIAISPEKPEYLTKMIEKTEAQFTLLYDEDYQIAKAYDVNFNPSTKQLFMYNVGLGAKLKETHSNDTQSLPIPATYIINQKGLIVWRQFDPDYKSRSSVNEILEALEKIQMSN